MAGVLMAQAGMEEDDERMQTISGLCSVIGRVETDSGLATGLYGPSIKVRLTDATVLLGRSGKSGGSSSAASGVNTGWKMRKKRRDGSS